MRVFFGIFAHTQLYMQSTISIKPHLKKFLLKYLNTCEPVKLDSTHVLGKIFIAINTVHRDSNQIKFTEHEYRETLTFSFSTDIKRPKKRDLNKVNIYFDMLFKDMMYQWALSELSSGGTASDGLRNFLKYYGISEDDYAWLNAHRAWMRYTKREYKKSKRQRHKCAAVVS